MPWRSRTRGTSCRRRGKQQKGHELPAFHALGEHPRVISKTTDSGRLQPRQDGARKCWLLNTPKPYPETSLPLHARSDVFGRDPREDVGSATGSSRPSETVRTSDSMSAPRTEEFP